MIVECICIGCLRVFIYIDINVSETTIELQNESVVNIDREVETVRNDMIESTERT